MVNIPKPPSRVTGKGTPPRSDDLSTVVGNNTEKPEAKKRRAYESARSR